jgi:hypothetical protein
MRQEDVSFINFFGIVGVHIYTDVSARSATGNCQRKSVRAWSRRSYVDVVGEIGPLKMEVQEEATVSEMEMTVMERR